MATPGNCPSCSRFVILWALALGLLLALYLGLTFYKSETPNRLETLQHKKEVMAQRQDKDRFFKTSQQSPLLDEQQWKFKALNYYPVDIAYRVTARYQSLAKPVEFKVQTSTGHERVYITKGRFDFTLKGQPLTLFAYQEKGAEPRAQNILFVPFADRTSGSETYGGGRYLEVETPPADSLVLDFNLAYNPYCAYNYNFSCPLPPPENHLDQAIEAGEKLFPLGQPSH